MIELLQLGRRHGWRELQAAVEQALALGCADAAAVGHLLAAPALGKRPAPAIELGALADYERPLPSVTDYDQLLPRPALTEVVQ